MFIILNHCESQILDMLKLKRGLNHQDLNIFDLYFVKCQ